MKRRGLVIVLAAVVLAGCSSNEPAAAPSATPTAETVACSDVSDGMVASVQWGLDERQAGFTVDTAVSLPAPELPGRWLVAASISGPGVDGQLGVWSSSVDPATATNDAALLSVDGIAAEFSDYARPAGVDASMDGVSDVRSCLR